MAQPLTLSPAQLALDAGVLQRAVQEASTAQLLASWFGLPNYHKPIVESFVRTVVAIVLGGQQAVVDLTYSYVNGQMAFVGENEIPHPGYQTTTGEALRGVAPDEVYARPFKDVWQALQRELELDQAIERGATRLRELVETDMQLAHTHTVRDMYTNTKLSYRRVLVGPTNCALCIVASTQRYHKADLLPIHPHCNCKTVPATEKHHVLDQALLDEVHREIAERFGVSDRAGRKIDYRKILLTRDHGEYGPTLTYSRDLFTGPDDLLKAARKG